MKKILREQAYNKTNGFCWYCGSDITENNFEVDHIHPKYRGGLDDIKNLSPSCRACNRLKTVFTVEEFREQIQLQVIRGINTSLNMRTAIRFNQIEITYDPVVFYFETLTPNLVK